MATGRWDYVREAAKEEEPVNSPHSEKGKGVGREMRKRSEPDLVVGGEKTGSGAGGKVPRSQLVGTRRGQHMSKKKHWRTHTGCGK